MMTNEEASVFLSDMESRIESETVLNHVRKEALQTAIKALQKQIPKKPQEGNAHIVYLCPNCGSLDYTLPYCKYCGQHLSFKEV